MRYEKEPCAMCAPKRRHRPPQALSIDELRMRLHYSPETGCFTWKVMSGPNHPGSSAGSINECGYVGLQVAGKKYKAHRVAWAFVHGQWPVADIDHVNGSRADNRIDNLRDVSRSVNLQNQRWPRSDNKSGYLGVAYDGASGKYRALIQVGGETHHLGRFDDPEQAHEAYVNAKRQLHPGSKL